MRKYLLLTIFFILNLSFNTLALSRVAVVGHSNAANFAWYNNIDTSFDSCAWITNHAVGGDGLLSYGFYSDMYLYKNSKEPKKFYPKGYGANRISNFTEDCVNYDVAIFMNGENEFKNYDKGLKEYLISLDAFLDKIRKNNSNIKMICFPMYNKFIFNSEKEKWNNEIRKIYKKYNCFIEEWPDNMGRIDEYHFNKISNQLLYKYLVKKYNL